MVKLTPIPRLFALIVFAFLAGLNCADNIGNDGDKIKVVVSIPPQTEFAEKIGGENIEIILLVPAGSDPHVYEPTPSQLRDIASADIYFTVGSGIELEETWGGRIIAANEDMFLADGSKGINLKEKDPHIWLSPANARTMCRNLHYALIEVDPDNKALYDENLAEYLDELDEMDREIDNKLASIIDRRFLVYHPSWAYFCDYYDFEQITVEEHGHEASAADIKAVIDKARNSNIDLLVESPQYDTRRTDLLESEADIDVIIVDPLAVDYTNNLRFFAEKLANGLE